MYPRQARVTVVPVSASKRNALCAQCAEEGEIRKRTTIFIDKAAYEGPHRTIRKRRMSQLIEDLLRPHVMDSALDAGYQAMAADKTCEADAMQWCNAVAADMADEAR